MLSINLRNKLAYFSEGFPLDVLVLIMKVFTFISPSLEYNTNIWNPTHEDLVPFVGLCGCSELLHGSGIDY